MNFLILSLIAMVEFGHSSKALAAEFTVTSSDGIKIAAQEFGNPKGHAIVFVHGLGQSHMSWQKQYNDQALLKQYRLITYDMRGHGDSEKPQEEEAYSDLNRYVDDLGEVLKKSNVKHPILVGWSLGGYVLAGYLDQSKSAAPGGFVFVDAATLVAPQYVVAGSSSLREGRDNPDIKIRREGQRRFISACFEIQPTDVELEQMLNTNLKVPVPFFSGLVKALTNYPNEKISRELEGFVGPSLVVQGRHDRLISSAMSEETHRLLKKSELLWFEKSGHAPFWEEPEKFNSALASFVDRAKK